MPTDQLSEVKKQVASQFADDNVRPDEVVLADDGDILIDRRRTMPWAQPVCVGRWKK